MVHLDMSGNDREILQTSEEILSIFNHVDILINCAGVSHRGTVQDTDLQVLTSSLLRSECLANISTNIPVLIFRCTVISCR